MEIPPAAVAAADFDESNARSEAARRRLPVVAFGRITPPARGEELLRAGDADLIGMARQLIADPETPNKLRAGRGDLVRVCASPATTAASIRSARRRRSAASTIPAPAASGTINERLVAQARRRADASSSSAAVRPG